MTIPGNSSLWGAAAQHVLKVGTADLKKQLLQSKISPLQNPQIVAKISAIIAALPSVKNLKLNPEQLKKFSQMVWFNIQASQAVKFALSAVFKSKL